MYQLLFSPQAKKDAKKHQSSGLKPKVMELLQIIEKDPLQYLKGKISRRINKQHRLVYEVLEEAKVIKVLRMWTHYD
ncbi:MAG: Txe/YoeB family addiction module toxin [Sulfuricurvum sp.]